MEFFRAGNNPAPGLISVYFPFSTINLATVVSRPESSNHCIFFSLSIVRVITVAKESRETANKISAFFLLDRREAKEFICIVSGIVVFHAGFQNNISPESYLLTARYNPSFLISQSKLYDSY